jgi:arylsulfatase A-like enzyme
MPTTLELAGINKPSDVQFKSLMPLIQGKVDKTYEAVYGGYKEIQRMVTEGDYKLILYPKVPVALLYNLKADPHEMNNLADKPGYSSTVKKLFARLVELQKQTGDELDLKRVYPDL